LIAQAANIRTHRARADAFRASVVHTRAQLVRPAVDRAPRVSTKTSRAKWPVSLARKGGTSRSKLQLAFPRVSYAQLARLTWTATQQLLAILAQAEATRHMDRKRAMPVPVEQQIPTHRPPLNV